VSQVFSEVDPSVPHVVSRLGLEAREVDESSLVADLVIRPDLMAASGAPMLGPLGSFLDTIGGVVGAIATFPTAIATGDLGVAIDPRARPRAVRTCPRVVRAGRTNVVTEMVVVDADTGAEVGYSTMTSTLLSPDTPQIYDPRIVTRMMRADYTPRGDFYAELGLVRGPDLGRDGGPGARLELAPWLGNSMGMMHGGCTIMVVEAAALAAADALRPTATGTVVDVHVRYLNGARVGPVVGTPYIVGVEADAVTVRVEQWDLGRDRVTALATARVVLA
jgi:acyl-coenzyme A thioesterase PaaI-like protein